jgi:uncharacterized repeat protein (TIGR02543 family)
MPNQTVEYGVAENLDAEDLSKTGYTFAGWNTSADGSGTSYADGDLITLTGDATLYAIWTLETYQITFENNGGTGSMANQTVEYEVAENLTAGNLSRLGYTFTGWSTSPTGGVEYADAGSITLTGDATLYAVWSVVGYSVTFEEQRAGDQMVDLQYNQFVRSIKLPSITRTGYTFRGWFTASTMGTRVGGAGDPYSVPGNQNVTYYAQWSINRYYIVFNNNGSTFGDVPAPQFGNYDTSVVIRGNTGSSANRTPLVRTGYTFVGWSSSPTGAGTVYTAGVSSYIFPAQNATMYAIWAPNAYTVTFDNNGGDGSMSVQNTFHGSTTALNMFNTSTLVAPAGKVFGGWATNANGTGTRYTDGQNITPTGNITLYARWLQQP